MLWLLFYWRFEKEKGFDQLIQSIKELNKRKVDFEIFIFGKGSLEHELLEVHDKNVHYFWWKPLDEIKKYLPNIDYCLMPSEFLETFWLSALNALSWWVPVIWYKKWWLEPFIFHECDLFLAEWNSTSEKIVSIVEKLSKKTNPEMISDKKAFELKIKNLLKDYTEDARYQRFLKLSGFKDNQNKKILIVSDFVNKAWWIETYIHDVKNLLETHWFDVILWWWILPRWFVWKWKKRIWLILFPFNIRSGNKIKKVLRDEKPDLIWFNSLLRWLWPNVVKFAYNWKNRESNQTKIWMMYHDFWYFYSFPSELYNLDDCKTPLTKENFLSSWKCKNIIMKLAIFFKYYWLLPLMNTLKKCVDLHLTPSECVTKIASESYNLNGNKCKSFPHFIQK